MDALDQLFVDYRIPLGDWIESGVNVLLDSGAGPFFRAIRWPIDVLLNGMEDMLLALPWPVVVLLIALIGWRNAGVRIGVLSGVLMTLCGFLGYWPETMTTLSMVITALLFSVILGIPLGIVAARNDRLDGMIRGVLDAMQTIHPFVYLVPIVMFFGIGKVPGTMATIIFALPPIVRLTNLGIRQVPKEVVEAGRSFGSDDMQLLWEVQIPLAMPSIMAGLNQTLMLALSMVVIIALIAGGGLGGEILRSVGRLDIGRAFTSGLAVLFLAVVLDRISQAQRGGTQEGGH